MSASTVHPDRRGQQPWLLVALFVASGACGAMAGQAIAVRNGTPAVIGQLAGVSLSTLALAGLPSVSIRAVARTLAVLSGLLLVRFGVLSGTILSGDQLLLVWLAGAVAVFVLSDRLAGELARPLQADGGDRAEPATTARTVLAVIGVIILLAVLLAPSVLPHVGEPATAGSGPRVTGDGSGGSLRSSDELDMTQRPELTDEVVLRVETDRRTFWRGETYDRWDGRTWTRSNSSRYLLDPGGTVFPSPDDIGVNGTDEFTQRFHVESDYADVVFSAASPVQVTAPVSVAQRFDGTISTANAALGKGATYTVRSRRTPLTPERLRAIDGEIPGQIASRYASPPTTTDRVAAAARRVAADEPTTYDKVVALERWMGARTKYSLDAPLSPRGVDVVDHFLFDSKLGWCEQIASSLVVLARANGIPARLVTGYVPDERDRVTGTFVVRAKDAHAWAEVWFPEVGWVPFDPTADVPLAGSDAAEDTFAQWVLDHLVAIVLVTAAVGLGGWALARLVRRRAQRRRARPVGWAAEATAALERLGERVDRPRQPWETASAYAEALARRYREPDLAPVGRLLDDELFAPSGHDRADDRARADLVLAALAAAEVPEPDPVPA